jgi:hypothetical protein
MMPRIAGTVEVGRVAELGDAAELFGEVNRNTRADLERVPVEGWTAPSRC